MNTKQEKVIKIQINAVLDKVKLKEREDLEKLYGDDVDELMVEFDKGYNRAIKDLQALIQQIKEEL